jgi:hypothetical protein
VIPKDGDSQLGEVELILVERLERNEGDSVED